MAFTNTKESGLEALIVKWLVDHNGYEQGTNADYNREYAVDETRLFRFLQDTQPDALEKLGVFKSDLKKKQFLNRLQGEIAKRGIIDVLRNGVKIYPARPKRCLRRTFSASPDSCSTLWMLPVWRWISAYSSTACRSSLLS